MESKVLFVCVAFLACTSASIFGHHNHKHHSLFHDTDEFHPVKHHQELEDVQRGGQETFVVDILHFNDVYEIKGNDKKKEGGAPRFVTLINNEIAAIRAAGRQKPLIVFSGDVLNPSMLSQATRGRHMVHVLKELGVDVAVLGNHEFDFGLEHATSVLRQFGFPWLCANLLHQGTDNPLAGAKRTETFELENGLKIGFLGVVELEWLRVSCLDENAVDTLDPANEAQRLTDQLRDEGADVVIALTHMREYNDRNLAGAVSNLDLVLGGHDHYYADFAVQKREGEGDIRVVKSGSDFNDLSHIMLTVTKRNGRVIDVHTQVRRLSSQGLAEDPNMREYVDNNYRDLEAKMSMVIGHTDVDLDARESSLRTSETNIGNFVADVMKYSLGADVAILNSGTIRYNDIIPAGPITLQTLTRTLPMLEELVVLRMTGSQILEALNNGVSKWPAEVGQFPQVSGIRFAFNGHDRNEDSRVFPNSVFINDQPLDMQKQYLVATKQYLANGKDGYSVLQQAEVYVDSEECPVLPTAVRNHFTLRGIVYDKMRTAEMRAIDVVHRAVARRFERVKFTRREAINPTIEGRIINTERYAPNHPYDLADDE